MIFEKVIEKIEELHNEACFPCDFVSESQGKVYNYFESKLKDILKLTDEYNNGWISVESELPEPYKKVLVLEENGEIHLCWYHNESTRFYYDGSDWDIKLGCVTHWRELPQPPKGE